MVVFSGHHFGEHDYTASSSRLLLLAIKNVFNLIFRFSALVAWLFRSAWWFFAMFSVRSTRTSRYREIHACSLYRDRDRRRVLQYQSIRHRGQVHQSRIDPWSRETFVLRQWHSSNGAFHLLDWQFVFWKISSDIKWRIEKLLKSCQTCVCFGTATIVGFFCWCHRERAPQRRFSIISRRWVLKVMRMYTSMHVRHVKIPHRSVLRQYLGCESHADVEWCKLT